MQVLYDLREVTDRDHNNYNNNNKWSK